MCRYHTESARRQRVAKLAWVTAAILLLSAASGNAHDYGHDVPAVSNSEAYRPTPLPDRIVLTWTGDPATTQTVTWRTDDSIAEGYAEIAVAEDGPEFAEFSDSYPAETVDLPLAGGHAHCHTVCFQGLTPETIYAYRVGDGVNWSEWNQFRSASRDTKPFSFVYFGDAQNDVHSHWSRVVREAYRDAPRAAFMLHAGDLINRASADGEWGEWFAASGHIHRMIPCIATPGNHEYEGTMPINRLLRRAHDHSPQLSRHWRPTFAFPENGPAGLEETVYWIDYQGARIISLNSNERINDQTGWLESVLENNPHRWTIITFHHPIYSTKPSRDNLVVRDAWQPLFDRYKVDLVLQGHDHTYARSGMMVHENLTSGVTAHNEEAGTVYVVSVSGPKMYPLGDHLEEMHQTAEGTQLYQIIHVDRNELRYEARTPIGTLYDAFTLHKRSGAANQLVDHVPLVPAKIRDASLAGR